MKEELKLTYIHKHNTVYTSVENHITFNSLKEFYERQFEKVCLPISFSKHLETVMVVEYVIDLFLAVLVTNIMFLML